MDTSVKTEHFPALAFCNDRGILPDVMWWWFKRAGPALGEVRRRLDEVELDVAALAKQLEKLRGRATGGIRRQNGDEHEADPPGMPPGLDPRSRRIWMRRLSRGGRKEEREA